HDEPIGHYADHDRGYAVQHIGDKAYDIAIAVSSVLGKKDTSTDSHRHPEQTGNGKNDHRAHDSVRHSAAGFAYRLRSLGEEGKIDRADALINQICKDREERQKHED